MAKKSRRQTLREQSIRDEVLEIFTMFQALQRSYAALLDKSGIAESQITFEGFDGNNEDEHLRIANELALCRRNIKAFNSHFPVLAGYRMLLQRWRLSQDKENLTKNDILRIIGD